MRIVRIITILSIILLIGYAGSWQELGAKRVSYDPVTCGTCQIDMVDSAEFNNALKHDPQLNFSKKKAKYVKKSINKQVRPQQCRNEPNCVPMNGDGTCNDGYIRSPDSIDGCIPIEVPADNTPPISPGILTGSWKGNCPGAGNFQGNVGDNYESITGCYSPEERFVNLNPPKSLDPNEDGIADGFDDDGDDVIDRPIRFPPRDDVLALHPDCVPSAIMLVNSPADLAEGKPASQLSCLHDYLDDIDDFCGEFDGAGVYKGLQWVWSTSSSCWDLVERPVIIQPIPGEHYMPLSLYLVDGTPLESTPESVQYGRLGEYGYNRTAIYKTDYPWNPYDIYNLRPPAVAANSASDPVSDDKVLNRNNMGRKLKLKNCIKLYIEEFAHRADCGEILLKGADPDVDISQCQWVTRYAMNDHRTMLQQAAQVLLEAIASSLDSTLGLAYSGGAVKGLRSEYYDYQNFNTAGWIPGMPAVGDGEVIASSDICARTLGNGSWVEGLSTAFNDGAKLVFSRRGCPSLSAPNIWPDFFTMRSCDFDKGEESINYLTPHLPGPSIPHAILTTRIEDGAPKTLMWTTPTDMEGGLENYTGIMTDADALHTGLHKYTLVSDGAKATNWIDPTHPARICTRNPLLALFPPQNSGKDAHGVMPDWDVGIFGFGGSDCLLQHTSSTPCKVSGFQFDSGGTLYDFDGNLLQLQEGAWCEFEVPFLPFGDSYMDYMVRITDPGHLNPHLDLSLISGAISSLGLGASPGAPARLDFDPGQRMIERIRDGCGAFTIRGTWIKDPNASFARWLIDRNYQGGRCDDWIGAYGKDFSEPRILSWRLPRFNYEFLKSFIECTGPVRSRGPDVCADGVNWVVLAYNVIPKLYGGCGCYMKLDDATEPNHNYTPGQPSGFWCRCKSDNILTTNCNEGFCTCNQNVLSDGYSLLAVTCAGYGPFKRWLMCYYAARAKSCSILTRDVSTGISGSSHMVTNPTESHFAFVPGSHREIEPAPPNSCSGVGALIPRNDMQNLRWNLQEPNILARLPVAHDHSGYAGGSNYYKHHELVYLAQVKDIQAPFIEPIIPWPVSKGLPDETALRAAGLLRTTVLGMGNVNSVEDMRFDRDVDAVTAAWKAGGTERAMEGVVGPRGCDIGGWYEMMLYQARCIRQFRLNCLCDYNKTFIEGSAEAYVLRRAGAQFISVRPGLTPDKKQLTFNEGMTQWPLMWRGFAGPDYAPDATQGSKLWDKDADGVWDDNYLGLSEAKVGDFMIYDEEIMNREIGAVDLRYRRHIAYVERVSNGMISVSEWNWGKNLDSCGNTDRWKTLSYRRIYQGAQEVPADQVCDNPDWANCYEANWKWIKLYRPDLDIQVPDDGDAMTPPPPVHPRPLCDIPESIPTGGPIPPAATPGFEIPRKITSDLLDLQGVQTIAESREAGDTAENMISNGVWKRYQIGSYDNREVTSFIQGRSTLGRCDPPVEFRLATSEMERQYSQNLTRSAKIDECDAEKGCPTQDQTKSQQPFISPGNSGASLPNFPGDGFDFTGLCALLGAYNNLCKMAIDCVTSGWTNCPAKDCFDASLDYKNGTINGAAFKAACAPLCAVDPTNKTCAVVHCIDSILSGDVAGSKACCAVIDIPECCDFVDAAMKAIECFENPGYACCEVVQLAGYAALSQVCTDLLACGAGFATSSMPSATCCNLLPAYNKECRGALGCLGNPGTATCCGLFPDDRACLAMECFNNPGVTCCQLLDELEIGGSLLPSGWDWKSACSAITACRSSPDTACCKSLTGLPECAAIDCYTNFSGGVIDPKKIGMSCCAMLPSVPLCTTFFNCIANPDMTCCNSLTSAGVVPPGACQALDCFNNIMAAATPQEKAKEAEKCCNLAQPMIPQCSTLLTCMAKPSAACCNLVDGMGFGLPVSCADLLTCANSSLISDGSVSGLSDEEFMTCCGLIPENQYCDVLLSAKKCYEAPSAECCNVINALPMIPAKYKDKCVAMFECADAFQMATGAMVPNKATISSATTFMENNDSDFDAAITGATPALEVAQAVAGKCCQLFPDTGAQQVCEDVAECTKLVSDPTTPIASATACCSALGAGKPEICGQLADCALNPGEACCALFPDAAAQCTAILACLASPSDACCSVLGADKVKVCEGILECLNNGPTYKCCKAVPAFDVACDLLFNGGSYQNQCKEYDAPCWCP